VSYTVRLKKTGFAPPSDVFYTFATHTPFTSLTRKYDFDDSQPPRLVSTVSTWTLDGIILGTESTLATDYAALKAKLENPNTYPDGLELVKDPSTVVETLSGYAEFKVELLELPQSDRQWRTEIRFRVKVSGKQRYAQAGTLPPNLADYKVTHSWSYDETGLATETLQGEIEVSSGSAVATARLLGLTLSGTSRFVTNGPEGVDVEQLDRADRKARFTSTMRELGLSAPASVGPSFSVTRQTTVQANGEELTTTSVSAAGAGAESAVKSYRPASVFTESVSVDNFQRRSSGTFVTKKIITQKTHRFTVTGGGRGFRWTRRTNGRKPARHTASFGEVTIREDFRVETLGDPSPEKFKIPVALTDVPSNGGDAGSIALDTSGFELQGPEVLEFGKDRASTKWAITLHRRYQCASFAEAAAAIFRAAAQDQATRGDGAVFLAGEISKPDGGQ
jgi:hypothetical protein